MVDPHDDCQQGETPDERLSLPIEQGVLLWCMRMLVVEMKRGIPAEERVEEMLSALGASSASPCLKSFVVALSRNCTRMIEVQCICQKQLSQDERALLDVLALAQAARPFEATLVLRGFLTRLGADSALRGAEAVGMALARAGRFLPEPEEEVRLYGLCVPGAASALGATLH